MFVTKHLKNYMPCVFYVRKQELQFFTAKSSKDSKKMQVLPEQEEIDWFKNLTQAIDKKSSFLIFLLNY